MKQTVHLATIHFWFQFCMMSQQVYLRAAVMLSSMMWVSACELMKYHHLPVSEYVNYPAECEIHTHPGYHGHINCAYHCRQRHCFMFGVDIGSCAICQYNGSSTVLSPSVSMLMFIRGKMCIFES